MKNGLLRERYVEKGLCGGLKRGGRMAMLLCFVFFVSSFFLHAAETRYAASSVLAKEGKWVKIQVDQTGIYKLSYAELKKMGFSDPAKVAVYGYGGCMLEEDFTADYPDDVPATAVWRGSDYLLFYARGPIKWQYSLSNGTFVHTNNPYSSYGYYFVTDAADVKEMSAAAKADGATLKITSFDDYQLHEKDLVSLNESGRELFGESFESNTSQNFSFSVPGITNEEAKVTMRFVSKATSGYGQVSLSIGGNAIVETSIPQSSANDSYTKARAVERVGTWNGDKTENIKANVVYGSSNHKNVRLDYIRLQTKRTLKPYGGCTLFRSIASIGNDSRYIVSGANSNTMVFDVTDCHNPQRVETTLNGSELTFTAPGGSLREYALVQTDQTLPTPTTIGTIDAQDLHAMPQTDMIIISPKTFRTQAERLAEEHRKRDGLTVQVVDPIAIYNEFSSGTPDATAYRRFMKMFYDRKTSDQDAPKYLLLFGDGLYDNRGVTSAISSAISQSVRDNMLLTYQSQESLNIQSYVTDDYYGLLADGSGKRIETDRIQIGIGRIPVRSNAEAQLAVDKLIAYMDNKEVGVWKNKLAFVADDGSSADSYTTLHMEQANTEATYIEENHPEFLANRVFFDAYKKDFSGTGTYPDVRAKIQKLLKEGLMLINYTGHGNTQSWSDEQVLTQRDIAQYTYPYLPLWVTATCDFTRFDAPATSAGEDVFLNKVSGGISLYTTTRAVYPGPNFILNKALLANLFEKKADGTRRTLGEVMKETKLSIVDGYSYSATSNEDPNRGKLNFILIGDPAMKLAYPEYRMKVTAVNGSPVTDSPVTFKALQRITIEGEVLAPDGSLATGFTGILNPTVMDSKEAVTTLDNNRTGAKFEYMDYQNAMFVGNDSVRNGKFSFTFTVPKDISYSGNYGKMSLYAADDTSGIEAQGAFLNYTVGGTADDVEKDTVGPEIRAMFLNDSTFTEGAQVNTTPLFYARVWDRSGVNISGSSIGHDIMLVIDNQPSTSYELNSYYEALPGTDGEGIIKFSIPALEPGKHTAQFKIWDVQNNSTDSIFTFEVVAGLKPWLTELVASPNPARDQVEFRLSHNRPETKMEVTVMVYDLAGRLVWSHTENGSSDAFKSYIVTWNLSNNGGSRLRPGLYLYRAAISSDNSKEATKANKLIILAQ